MPSGTRFANRYAQHSARQAASTRLIVGLLSCVQLEEAQIKLARAEEKEERTRQFFTSWFSQDPQPSPSPSPSLSMPHR
jgi:hypothetical protein